MQSQWNTEWKSFRKLKTEVPFDPEIPLWGIYPKEVKAGSQRNICTPMFMAALLTVAKRSKQPKCASADERTDKMWCPNTTGGQKERNSDTCYRRGEARKPYVM